MFNATFAGELASRVGSRVQVATSSQIVDGILSSVEGNLITLLDTNGYGPNVTIYLTVNGVVYVRFVTPV